MSPRPLTVSPVCSVGQRPEAPNFIDQLAIRRDSENSQARWSWFCASDSEGRGQPRAEVGEFASGIRHVTKSASVDIAMPSTGTSTFGRAVTASYRRAMKMPLAPAGDVVQLPYSRPWT
jgi:hypothetical protein